MAAIIGDTVRLKAEFRTFGGILFSPDNVILRIYDGARRVITEAAVAPVEEGKFEYDFTVPGDYPGPLAFEFSGELEGSPTASRQYLERKWA